MPSLIVTLVGPDRPGVVSAVSDKASAHDANWTDSVLAEFAGQFAGIVHLQVAEDRRKDLIAALRSLESPDLHIVVAAADADAKSAQVRRVRLELVGHDRPGIIRSISGQLARHGVNIEKMKTHIASGAMSGEQMFHLNAQLTVPAGLDSEVLRDGLESLANELMVDITFDSHAADSRF